MNLTATDMPLLFGTGLTVSVTAKLLLAKEECSVDLSMQPVMSSHPSNQLQSTFGSRDGSGKRQTKMNNQQGAQVLNAAGIICAVQYDTLSESSRLALAARRWVMQASRPSKSPSSRPLAAMCSGVCPSCDKAHGLVKDFSVL